jgi:2-polyprenyl-3-methyl-5-hydroxy-6-metoxy-1,4-benzoquinol methylase
MSTDRTQGFFHQYAGDFDAIYSNQTGLANGIINNLFRKSMKLRFVRTIEGCTPIEGKSVLDVGCGPGHYSITLAQRGAAKVVGIDFAEGMLQIAAQHANRAGVGFKCHFRVADFRKFDAGAPFDYVILMGFMDYMADPRVIVEKALSLTRSMAFFSFPVGRGFLAWQRSLRYRNRCDLFLYRQEQLEELFSSFSGVQAKIEPISRDFFVSVSLAGSRAAAMPQLQC